MLPCHGRPAVPVDLHPSRRGRTGGSSRRSRGGSRRASDHAQIAGGRAEDAAGRVPWSRVRSSEFGVLYPMVLVWCYKYIHIYIYFSLPCNCCPKQGGVTPCPFFFGTPPPPGGITIDAFIGIHWDLATFLFKKMVTENSHQHFDVSISDFLYFVFGYTPPLPPSV